MRAMKGLSSVALASVLSLGLHADSKEASKVIPEHIAVHSQPSPKAPVIATFERGRGVLVDLVITSSDGAWCLVREPGRKEPAGYLQCNQLTKEALPQLPSAVPKVTQPTTTPAPNHNDSRMAASTSTAEFVGMESWSTQLGLTEHQRNAVAQALETSGLAACRDDLENAYHSYGVTDAYSLLKRIGKTAKNPFNDSFTASVEPKIRRGAVRYKSFWQVFWNTLTAEQRKNATHSPTFLLAYLGSQSDPEGAFNDYVLQHMSHSRAGGK